MLTCICSPRFGDIMYIRRLPDRHCAFVNYNQDNSASQALLALQVGAEAVWCVSCLYYCCLCVCVCVCRGTILEAVISSFDFLRTLLKKLDQLGKNIQWYSVTFVYVRSE